MLIKNNSGSGSNSYDNGNNLNKINMTNVCVHANPYVNTHKHTQFAFSTFN